MWDVDQYERFRRERARPFFDLLARVERPRVARGADLGCGTGDLTRTLCDRWPDARITGVDSSAEMLSAAAGRAIPGRLTFERGDAARWRAEGLDLVVSNATLHWVPDHARLVPHLAGLLAPGGTLAVQMPDNFQAPSHRLVGEVSRDPRWAATLAGVARDGIVQSAAWYVEALFASGFAHVDAWETTYVHVLPGDDAVLDWLRGTTLRPVLARLADGEREDFLAELGARLRGAYPRGPHGTLLPFRRLFFVAVRPT